MKIFLILTTGRTGSDYLNRCLDGINNVITFPGKFSVNDFFLNEKDKIEKNKLINEFLKKYKFLFKNNIEENIKLNINLKKLKKIFLSLNNDTNLISRREFVINIHKSYYLTIGKKLKKDLIIIHHTHGVIETKTALQDFPKAKIFITIRHPLANLKSGLQNWTDYLKKKLPPSHALYYIFRIRRDLQFANKLKNKKMFIKLEEANEEKVKKKIFKFLGVKFNKTIFKATINGKPWVGDALSKIHSNDGKYLNDVKDNNWKLFFNNDDQELLSFVYENYQVFGYKLSKIKKFFIFFKIFQKLKIEEKMQKRIITKKIKLNYKYLLLRKIYFLMILFKIDNYFKLKGY